MEAEILAVVGPLVEGVAVKQAPLQQSEGWGATHVHVKSQLNNDECI